MLKIYTGISGGKCRLEIGGRQPAFPGNFVSRLLRDLRDWAVVLESVVCFAKGDISLCHEEPNLSNSL